MQAGSPPTTARYHRDSYGGVQLWIMNRKSTPHHPPPSRQNQNHGRVRTSSTNHIDGDAAKGEESARLHHAQTDIDVPPDRDETPNGVHILTCRRMGQSGSVRTGAEKSWRNHRVWHVRRYPSFRQPRLPTDGHSRDDRVSLPTDLTVLRN